MTDGATTLLLVEDDDGLRTILATVLRRRGYGVEEAPSAEAAVLALEGGLRPGVVLLDLNLPGATGWDFLGMPCLAMAGSPPVVVTSAGAVSAARLAEYHVAAFLPKPYGLESLMSAIAQNTAGGR